MTGSKVLVEVNFEDDAPEPFAERYFLLWMPCVPRVGESIWIGDVRAGEDDNGDDMYLDVIAVKYCAGCPYVLDRDLKEPHGTEDMPYANIHWNYEEGKWDGTDEVFQRTGVACATAEIKVRVEWWRPGPRRKLTEAGEPG